MTTTLRARFDGKVLIPLDPVDLPQGRVLEIRVCEDAAAAEGAAPPPGSPAAILKGMEAPRHATDEDIDEMERLIEQAKLPVRYRNVFDEQDQ